MLCDLLYWDICFISVVWIKPQYLQGMPVSWNLDSPAYCKREKKVHSKWRWKAEGGRHRGCTFVPPQRTKQTLLLPVLLTGLSSLWRSSPESLGGSCGLPSSLTLDPFLLFLSWNSTDGKHFSSRRWRKAAVSPEQAAWVTWGHANSCA